MDDGCMPLRDKSVTLMRFYGFPHHGDRFFAGALNDALPVFLTTGTDPSHSFRMTFYGLLHHDSEPSSSLRVIPDRPPSEGAVAHAARLRILNRHDDSNRKRIFSLQLTAHS